MFRLNHTVAKALHSIFKDIISSHTTNIQLFLSGQILMVTFSSTHEVFGRFVSVHIGYCFNQYAYAIGMHSNNLVPICLH